MIENLLGIGLANVDDCQPEEVPFLEQSWPHAEAGRHPRGEGMRPPARSHPGGVAPVRRDVSASQA